MLDNHFIDKAGLRSGQSPRRTLAFAHEPPIEVDAPYVAEMVRQRGDRTARQRRADRRLRRQHHDRFDICRKRRTRRCATDLVDLRPPPRLSRRGGACRPDGALDARTTGTRVLADYRHDRRAGAGHRHAGDAPRRRWSTSPTDRASARPRSRSPGRAAYVDERSPRRRRRRKSTTSSSAATSCALARDDQDAWATDAAARCASRPGRRSIPRTARSGRWIGGFSFLRSKFNRVDAECGAQPGSGFKPFLYSAAFEHGFTPASIVNDAPVVFPDPSKPNGMWAPKNDDGKFDGPMRLREALVKSVNLVSVRLLDAIGVHYAREYITRFGIQPRPDSRTTCRWRLGTASVSPMAMARGYAVFANGGFLVDPYFVREIAIATARSCTGRPGARVPQLPERALAENSRPRHSRIGHRSRSPQRLRAQLNPIANCAGGPDAASARNGQTRPGTARDRCAQCLSSTSMMRDVVRRGTGSAAMVLKRNDLAGKTGSTNDHRDALVHRLQCRRLVTSCWVGLRRFRLARPWRIRRQGGTADLDRLHARGAEGCASATLRHAARHHHGTHRSGDGLLAPAAPSPARFSRCSRPKMSRDSPHNLAECADRTASSAKPTTYSEARWQGRCTSSRIRPDRIPAVACATQDHAHARPRDEQAAHRRRSRAADRRERPARLSAGQAQGGRAARDRRRRRACRRTAKSKRRCANTSACSTAIRSRRRLRRLREAAREALAILRAWEPRLVGAGARRHRRRAFGRVPASATRRRRRASRRSCANTAFPIEERTRRLRLDRDHGGGRSGVPVRCRRRADRPHRAALDRVRQAPLDRIGEKPMRRATSAGHSTKLTRSAP